MHDGGTARLFVALDPSRAVRAELASWARLAASGAEPPQRSPRRAEGGRPIRALHAELLHLTLCFLGNRPVAEMQALVGVLPRCVMAVGELSIGAPLLLPPRRPRALAVEVHDSDGDLARLQSKVLAGVRQASTWEPSARHGFRAHITVGRMGAGVRWPAGRALPPTPALRFTPQTIGLYRSWLEPTGASYETVASCELPLDLG